MKRNKDEIRQEVWDALTCSGVARFPGAHGRIPNFERAEEAARGLAGLRIWEAANVIKCNPDAPQRPVRERALREGKIIYMAVPRLRDVRCFVELDPTKLHQDDLHNAGTIKGAFRLGRQISLTEMKPVDLIVAGSVAVNRNGGRVGKGGGYSDLEYALARAYNLVIQETPIVTTVHDLQILEGVLPRVVHDIPIDVVITPHEIIETHTILPRPEGIYWSLLPEDKIVKIPVLMRLQASKSGNRL
jgi:5-formyltetrahydrofolate cyclo-ligase